MGLGKRVNEVTIQEAIRADRWVLFALMIVGFIAAFLVFTFAIPPRESPPIQANFRAV